MYKAEEGVLEIRAKDFHSNYMTAVDILDDDTYLGAEISYNLFTVRKNSDAAADEDRNRLEVHCQQLCTVYSRPLSCVQCKDCLCLLVCSPRSVIAPVLQHTHILPQQSKHLRTTPEFYLMLLQVVGEYHLGDMVNRFQHGSLVMQLPDNETAHIPTLLFGTILGIIGVIASIPREQYEFLARLQVICMPCLQPNHATTQFGVTLLGRDTHIYPCICVGCRHVYGYIRSCSAEMHVFLFIDCGLTLLFDRD